MDLKKSAFTVSGFTMISRVLGFIRDILIANILGAGTIADTFFVAFRFPNLFRRLFAEGAFSAAFVPIFSDILTKESIIKARKFGEQAFSILILILICFLTIFEIIMPWAMYLLAPGFDSVPGKFELAVQLSRITLPYLLFISLVSLQSGILNALGHFGAAASAPILLNVVLISALLIFGGHQNQIGHLLAIAISLAGVAQFIWLSYHCTKYGFPVKLRLPKITKNIRLLGKRTVPVIFGASLYQINLLIGTILASLISDGAVSYLYYADRITQLPLGVIGVALGTALLPLLSNQISSGNSGLAKTTQTRGIEIALLFTIPATAGLAAISLPIVVVLFEHGAFSHQASLATSKAMVAYSVGLPAYVLIKVLAPSFFARGDTSRPVRIAAISLIINIVLNLLLMQMFGHIGIALASSISAWVNAISLAIVLHRRGHFDLNHKLMFSSFKIILASVLMGVVIFTGAKFINFNVLVTHTEKGFFLFILIFLGICVYGFFVVIFKVVSWKELRSVWVRRNM